MSRVVAIHQPNFFPWLPYFHKMVRADVFVLLDNVQFPKKGGTWINRVQVNCGGTPSYLTMPVVRAYHGLREIREMQIDESAPWRIKLLKTLQQVYRSAPGFDAVMPFVEERVQARADHVAAFNVATLRGLAERLGLGPEKILLASDFPTSLVSTERLVHLIKAVGGDTYFSGHGAVDYQEEEVYRHAGIRLVYQDFPHPVYPQVHRGEFLAGLSILDALFNLGWERTAALFTASG